MYWNVYCFYALVNINCFHFTFNGRFISISSCSSSSLVKKKTFFFFSSIIFCIWWIIFLGLNFNRNFTKAKVIHLLHFHFNWFLMKFQLRVNFYSFYFDSNEFWWLNKIKRKKRREEREDWICSLKCNNECICMIKSDPLRKMFHLSFW